MIKKCSVAKKIRKDQDKSRGKNTKGCAIKA